MIGQSAVLLTKFVMIEYVRHSETERVWVNNDGLINLNLLKIQSNPIGNYREIVGRRNEYAYAAECNC